MKYTWHDFLLEAEHIGDEFLNDPVVVNFEDTSLYVNSSIEFERELSLDELMFETYPSLNWRWLIKYAESLTDDKLGDEIVLYKFGKKEKVCLCIQDETLFNDEEGRCPYPITAEDISNGLDDVDPHTLVIVHKKGSPYLQADF